MYENQTQFIKANMSGGRVVDRERIPPSTPQPNVDSPLALHANEMDEALLRLEKLATDLMDRLYPVLGQVPESDRAMSGRGPASAPILDLLGGAIGRIGAVSDRLETMIARLVV